MNLALQLAMFDLKKVTFNILHTVRNFALGASQLVTARWDQVSNMVVVGLFFWIMVQNDAVANNMANHLMGQLESTLIKFLNGTGY